jgi:hypothetical protein
MQSLANLLPSASTASTTRQSPTSSPPASLPQLNESLVAKLFRAMMAEFGGRWSSQLATPEATAALKLEWWARVHDLSPAQLRRGLETMTVGQDAFPPGPRAFRKLCLAGDGDAVRTGIHALYLPEPPKAPMDRDQVVAGLAALRASLPRDEPPVAEYLPAGACSLAERRRFVARNKAALVAAGLGRFVSAAELELAMEPEPRRVNALDLECAA